MPFAVSAEPIASEGSVTPSHPTLYFQSLRSTYAWLEAASGVGAAMAEPSVAAGNACAASAAQSAAMAEVSLITVCGEETSNETTSPGVSRL